MIKFQITALAKPRPKGTEVIFRKVEPSLGTKRQYNQELNKFLHGMAAAYRLSVLPALRNHRQFTVDSGRQKAVDDETWFTSFEARLDQLEAVVNGAVASILLLEATRHTKKFIGAAKAALEIDIGTVIRNEDLAGYLEDAATRNAALIKSLRSDVVKEVRVMVLNAKTNGTSIKQLTADIRTRFKVAQSRANLIAEDQMNKLTADMNRIRQTQAGIDSYTWQTSGNERVRPLHRRLNGLRYRWGQRTGAEGGLAPGGPVRCRCSARAVVVF